MDASAYKAGLAELRSLREDIKKARTALNRLEARRDKQINALASHTKAKAEQIAPAAGLSIADVVAAAPDLTPGTLASPTTSATSQGNHASAALCAPAATAGAQQQAVAPPAPAPSATVAQPAQPPLPPLETPPEHTSAPNPAPANTATSVPDREPIAQQPRILPSIPPDAGSGWFGHVSGLASTRPNFTWRTVTGAFVSIWPGRAPPRSSTPCP
jgi:hypothetical protein